MPSPDQVRSIFDAFFDAAPAEKKVADPEDETGDATPAGGAR